MSQQRKQLAVLAVLAVVLVAVSARSFLRTSGGGGLRLGGGGSAEQPLELGEEVDALRVELLEKKPTSFRPGRDPFRFQQPPRPAAPPPRPQPQPQQRPAQAQPAQQAAAPRPQTPPRPQPPPIDFKYLGSFGPEGRQIAVFSDQAEIYNARKGEVVKEKFVVREIGYESADIGFVEFPNVPAKRLAVGG